MKRKNENFLDLNYIFVGIFVLITVICGGLLAPLIHDIIMNWFLLSIYAIKW